MKSKKILVITSRYPFPIRGGDKLRIAEIINFLSRKNTIDLVSVGNFKVKNNFIRKQFIFKNSVINQIYQMTKSFFNNEPLQIGFFKIPKMKKKINLISKNYDVIIFHLIRTCYYLPKNFKGNKILEMTDLISKNYKKVEKNISNNNPLRLIYTFEKKKLINYEKKMIKSFNYSVFVNRKDLDESLLINKKIKIIGNGTFKKKNIFLCNTKKNNIIFFGNINSLANRTACYEFIKNYLPFLKNNYPNLKFVILGNCSIFLKFIFKLHGVKVYSNIKNLSNFTQNTLAGICNVNIQSGLQNKILDYTSIGLPVLANKVSNNFSYLKSDDLLIYKDKKDFFIKLDKLYKNKSFQKKISKNCFKKTNKFYQWNLILERYNSLI